MNCCVVIKLMTNIIFKIEFDVAETLCDY